MKPFLLAGVAACLVSLSFTPDARADVACSDAWLSQTAGAAGASGAAGEAGEAGSGNPAPRPRGGSCGGDDDDDGCSVERVGKGGGRFGGLAALLVAAGVAALVADRRRAGLR